MELDDRSYYKAYDHNYRVAYEEGLAHLGEGGAEERALGRLRELLERTGRAPRGTRLLDVGCGDGTNGIFLAGIGYRYVGVDVSETAIVRARERASAAGLDIDIRVGDVLDLAPGPGRGGFRDGEFQVVLDSYCLHMLVLDAHRRAYFESVRRVLSDDGHLVLLADRDDAAYQGPVSTFEEFCRLTGTDPSGIPFRRCVDGREVEVPGRRCFLLGRARSLAGYRDELTGAGFEIEHQSTWDDRPGRVAKVGFVLRKAAAPSEKE